MEAAAVKPVLRVAAVCGSLRKASYNRGLLRAGIPASSLLLATTPARPLTPFILILSSRAAGLLNWPAAEVCEESIPGLRVDHVDISDLPLLNTDLETPDGGFPPAVEAFRDRVRSADCFLFGSPPPSSILV
jgi:NAD(P)H-dependent FMN reductase